MITSSCTTSSYICSTQCNETKYSQHSPSKLFQAPLNSTCLMACLLIFLLGTSFFSCSFFVLCFFSTILTSYRGLMSYNKNNTRKKINKIASINQSLRLTKIYFFTIASRKYCSISLDDNSPSPFLSYCERIF